MRKLLKALDVTAISGGPKAAPRQRIGGQNPVMGKREKTKNNRSARGKSGHAKEGVAD